MKGVQPQRKHQIYRSVDILTQAAVIFQLNQAVLVLTYCSLEHGLGLILGALPLYILNHDAMILSKLYLVPFYALLIFLLVNLGRQLVLHEAGHLLHGIDCHSEYLPRGVHRPVKFALHLLDLPVDLKLPVCRRPIGVEEPVEARKGVQLTRVLGGVRKQRGLPRGGHS